MEQQQTQPEREGAFSLAMGQFGYALGDVWRGKWTIVKLGLLMLTVAILLELVAVLIAPDAAISDYTEDFQEQILDEFDVDIDIRDSAGGSAIEGDDNSVEDIMYDIAEGIEQSDADQPYATDNDYAIEDELEGPDGSLEDFSWKDAMREGIEEDGHIGPNPIDAPIYTLINMISNFALYFVQYIIVIFAVSQTVLNKRQVKVGECLEAVRTCPWYFYTAAIKKWLWIMGPILVTIAAIIPLAAMSGSGEGALSVLLGLIIAVVTIIGFFIVIRRSMAYMFIEFYALFKEMRFREAKETSTAIMMGNKNGLFWAFMIMTIAFSLAFGIVAMLGIFLFAIPTIMLGFVAKWTAIVIGSVGFILFLAIIQIAPTYFFISWMYRIWQALLGRDSLSA